MKDLLKEFDKAYDEANKEFQERVVLTYPSQIEKFKEWLLNEKIFLPHEIAMEIPFYKNMEKVYFNAYQIGHTHGLEDAGYTPYCERCGSCGESGCCTPDMCRSVQLKHCIDSVLSDMIPNEPFNYEYFIDQVQERFKDGFYCDHNLKEYKDMVEECNKYYVALKAITEANYASNMIEIAKEAIK